MSTFNSLSINSGRRRTSSPQDGVARTRPANAQKFAEKKGPVTGHIAISSVFTYLTHIYVYIYIFFSFTYIYIFIYLFIIYRVKWDVLGMLN